MEIHVLGIDTFYLWSKKIGKIRQPKCFGWN